MMSDKAFYPFLDVERSHVRASPSFISQNIIADKPKEINLTEKLTFRSIKFANAKDIITHDRLKHFKFYSNYEVPLGDMVVQGSTLIIKLGKDANFCHRLLFKDI